MNGKCFWITVKYFKFKMFSKTFENASKIFKGFKTCQPKNEIFHFGGDATIFFA